MIIKVKDQTHACNHNRDRNKPNLTDRPRRCIIQRRFISSFKNSKMLLKQQSILGLVVLMSTKQTAQRE